MTTSYLTRIGSAPEEAIKAPCVASTPANIALSGEQTVDGIAVVSGNRVLVRSQTDPTENAVYDASTSAWTRATDWNDSTDVINGMLVADANAANDVIYKANFTGDFSPGITAVTFSETVSSGLITYTGSAGIQAEYDARAQYDVKYMDDLIGVDLTSFIVGEQVLCLAINVGSPGTYSTWQKVSDGQTAPDVATGVNTDGLWYSATTGATKFKRVRQTQIDNVAALKLYEGEFDGQQLPMRGYYAGIEGGGQNIQWDASSTATPNDGTIFQATGVVTGRWLSVDTSVITPEMFGAKGDNGVTDDYLIINNVLSLGFPHVHFTKRYRVTAPPAIQSNTLITGTPDAVIYNDRTSATISKEACFILGDAHGVAYADYTSYALNAVSGHDQIVTCTTAGDTVNFSVGELVYIATTNNVSGVPDHAQLTKIENISSGDVHLADAIDVDMTSPLIYKIAGTDLDLDVPWYAVENVQIYGLGFEGRSPFATKSAAYNCHVSDIRLDDVHICIGLNAMTNCVFENFTGAYSGRLVEFALNSNNVIARNITPGFKTKNAADSYINPIQVAEQSRNIKLENIPATVDSRFTPSLRIAELKGYNIEVSNCRWHHGGTANQEVLSINPSSHTVNIPGNMTLKNVTLSSDSTKTRIAIIGDGVSSYFVEDITLDNVTLDGAVTTEAIWYYKAKNIKQNILNNTGVLNKISSTSEAPKVIGEM